jgi:ferredoxin hydrogenase large subunit
MAGAVAKTYGALEVFKVAPERIYSVGIMPCTAKKFEAARPEFTSAYAFHKKQGAATGTAYPDVDAVLTTRDLARLFKKKGIDLAALPDAEPDTLFGQYTGAGTIFGATGGVMEAAVRTAHAVLTGKELQPLEFQPVRGFKGVKHATVPLTDTKYGKTVNLSVAVVHNMSENIRPVLEEVLAGRSPYHFIEVMNCPAGCVNGGGQPMVAAGSSWLGSLLPRFTW